MSEKDAPPVASSVMEAVALTPHDKTQHIATTVVTLDPLSEMQRKMLQIELANQRQITNIELAEILQSDRITVGRWRAHPNYQAALTNARKGTIELLIEGHTKGVRKLIQLLNSTNESIQLGAADRLARGGQAYMDFLSKRKTDDERTKLLGQALRAPTKEELLAALNQDVFLINKEESDGADHRAGQQGQGTDSGAGETT